MNSEYKYEVCARCFTFNQAKYIEDTMNGFAKQETTFPFICVIVDDASFDGEQEVIKNYLIENFQKPYRDEESDYAHVICSYHKTNLNCEFAVLLLKENHKSKGKDKFKYLAEWLGTTKYQALCEGDDWWISPHKLQLQHDILESKPNVDMCACGTICYKDGTEVSRMCPADKDRLLTVEEAILGGGSFLGTNSLFFRQEMMSDKYLFDKYLALDYFYQIHGSLRGGIYYLKETMSAYRVSSNGSWVKTAKSNPIIYFKHRERVITALNILDFETRGLYKKEIQEAKNRIYINQVISGMEAGVYAKNANFKERVKICLGAIKNLFR